MRENQQNITVITVSTSKVAGREISDKLKSLQGEALGNLLFTDVGFAEFQQSFDGKANLVILNLPDDGALPAHAIRIAQERGYSGPLLFPVEDLETWAQKVEANENFGTLKLFERPFEDHQLIGYVKRLLTLRGATFRAHRRYETCKPATIYREHSAYPCIIRNISHGGACFQFDGNLSLNRNDFITLYVSLDDSGEYYNILSRVAWVQKGKAMAGLEFISASSVQPAPSG